MNETCLRLILEVVLQTYLRRRVFETEIDGYYLEILSNRGRLLMKVGSLLRAGGGGGMPCLRS